MRAHLVLGVSVVLLAIAGSTASHAFASHSADHRLLIVHLDAVSFETFQEALAEGLLPNIEKIFSDGVLRPALTLFPGSTPVIYSRLSSGVANDGPGALGIGGWRDAETMEWVSEFSVRAQLVASVPRRAQSLFAYGWIAFPLAEATIFNLPALLERYRVVETFWFATDTIGHLEGLEAQKASLARLDQTLGRVVHALDLERLNVILYSDHGMSAATEAVNLAAIIRQVLGDAVALASYPNIYLHESDQAAEAARLLGEPRHFDLVAYRRGPSTVRGYLDGYLFEIEEEYGAYSYRSESDPFGYARLGYDGEALDADRWLTLTIDHPYPGAVPNIYRYLQNPNAGDVMFALNPPRLPEGFPQFVAHHYGVRNTDLLVPVLIRGPDLEQLLSEEPFWLHQLYQKVDVSLLTPTFKREENRLSVVFQPSTGALRLDAQISPAYRWRMAGEATVAGQDAGRWGAYLEREVVADYLFRLWLGAGVTQGANDWSPSLRATLELDLGPLRVSPQLSLNQDGWQRGVRVELAFRLGPGRVAVTQAQGQQLGLSYRW
jgi:hypothetical protein